MLAIFRKTLAHPPQELNSPTISSKPPRPSKLPDEILTAFNASHPVTAFAATFRGGAALSSAGGDFNRRRLFCALDDIYCVFVGCIDNLSSLIRQYGLCGKITDEALLVLEAYRTLRDRGPYPADQVVKDFQGCFAFVVYDNKTGTVFAALSSDGKIPMYWGIAADGSVVMSDELEIVKGGCGKSFAPFPTGCMFHSDGGLRSFEHPMNKMKAMPRVDSEGMMCGACFKVDTFSKINSMPRVGSAANWASWEDAH
ncbi:stem-specific protein TSJT1-like [Dioscorea cayenensis subsp. rotundata]|uniref:Stem-specific protein TSJT1-like n=1 Tax=Dioscorea cayennensis subsp. rotundata TaxID=55577 RepID=A0AB40C7Z4_DIOCR|nr:stem-specific protein TSJT1-like [Dioscorea cayenensis subsp. rotundata]